MHSGFGADALAHCFLPSSPVIAPRPESPTAARRGEEPGWRWRSPCRDCTKPGGAGRAPAASVHLLEQREGQPGTSWACSHPLQSIPAYIPDFPSYEAHMNSSSAPPLVSYQSTRNWTGWQMQVYRRVQYDPRCSPILQRGCGLDRSCSIPCEKDLGPNRGM